MEKQIDLEPKSTSFDFVARVSGSADIESDYKITDVNVIGDTYSLAYSSGKLYFEYNIAKKVIKRLWRLHRYNQEYITYLIGSYSKEEFKEIAKTYAEKTPEYTGTAEQLQFAVNFVMNTIEEPMTSNDLSLLLNIDYSHLDTTMKLIGYVSYTDEEE